MSTEQKQPYTKWLIDLFEISAHDMVSSFKLTNLNMLLYMWEWYVVKSANPKTKLSTKKVIKWQQAEQKLNTKQKNQEKKQNYWI